MLHRRDAMLRVGQFGVGGLALNDLLRAEQAQGGETQRGGKAKSVILVYLWGGPPQMDTWDLNPGAAEGIRTHFKPIATKTPGLEVCEHLPRFAQWSDKTAIIRSLSHESNEHEPSVYRSFTGHVNNALRVPRNQRNRSEPPNVGSVVSAFSKPGPMPAAVTIPRPIGHEGVIYSGTWGGYLGPKHDPMEVGSAGESSELPTHSMGLPPELSQTRLLARKGLLSTIEDLQRRAELEAAGRSLDSFRVQAFDMLSSPAAKEAFDLSREDPRTRDRYGRSEYGESLLLARRLVEAGVRLVTISWMYIQKSGNVVNVWDNHGPLEGLTGYGMLLAPYGLPALDQGFSALMHDLTESGLLDETLIAMYGEFGRTPKINAATGRDHWGACQSAVLAGGGVRGGQVYGSSDKDSAYPTSNPVSLEDMLATIYYSLGIDHNAMLYDKLNRPHRLVEGSPLTMLF